MRRFMVLVLMSLTVGCAAGGYGPTEKSKLTPGMVTTKIEVGKTSQAQVMEIFGPPDLVTREKDIEMWGYDKISRELAYGSFGIVPFGFATPGGAVAGGLAHAGTGYQSQTVKTVFLLVYFKDRVVVDYKLSATKF